MFLNAFTENQFTVAFPSSKKVNLRIKNQKKTKQKKHKCMNRPNNI